MDGLVKVFTELPDTKSRKDEDSVDRLSSTYSVILCVVFAVTVSMNQYVGDPITCWVPQHFTGSHTKYTNAYCWVRNTYYLPYDDEIPHENEEGLGKEIPYYQWIPFILLGQALMFYFPNAVWHTFNHSGGVDADTILDNAQGISRADKVDSREDIIMIIRNQVDRFLTTRKNVVPSNKEGGYKAVIMKGGVSGRRYGLISLDN